MPGFQIGNWLGVMAPAGTPPEVIAEAQRRDRQDHAEPEMKARMAEEGAETIGSTPEVYGDYIKDEIARWSEVVRRPG